MDTKFHPVRFTVIGGDGAMGSFMQQQLRVPMRSIDKKHFSSQYAIRRSRRSARAAMRDQCQHGVVFVSLPLDQFEDASKKPGSRSQLAHLFGAPGTGQRNTLLIHLSSIQKLAAEILDQYSGPVLGLHQLHRPGVSDLKSQTAIITVTSAKKCHHLYEESYAWLRQVVENMGYGTVLEMGVDVHDQFMANVQFLRHSMVLVAAAMIRQMLEHGHTVRQLLETPSIEVMFWLIHRILSGECHVYANIAKDNLFNIQLLENWRQSVQGLQSGKASDFMLNYFSISRKVVSDHFEMIGAKPHHQQKISTPFSRVSDMLMSAEIQPHPLDTSGNKIALSSVLQAYENAISGGYSEFFSELRAYWLPFLCELEFEPDDVMP